MRSRFFLVGAAVVWATPAFSSFDMMIVPDANGTAYQRFDPVNRVGLGQINIVSGFRVSANNARPTGVYQTPSGNAVVNNSTGELAGFPSGNLTENFVLHETSGAVARHSTLFLDLGNLNDPNAFQVARSWSRPSGLSIRGVIPTGASSWLVYGLSSTNGLSAYVVDSNGSTTAVSTDFVSAANVQSGGAGVGQGTTWNRGATRYAAIPYRDSTGAHRLVEFIHNDTSFGTSSAVLVNGFSSTNVNTMLSAVRGHSGYFLVGADATTPTSTRISTFTSTNFGVTQMGTYTTSLISVPTVTSWRMANIVAPEPGTMLALGAGAAMLLRRRRQSR